MWQTDWADKFRHVVHSPHSSGLDSASVAAVYLLSWSEHCIECAVPDCFQVCPLYVSRLDRKCARFKRGISTNPSFPGLFSYGAEIEFRRWGKLESTFGFGGVSPRTVRWVDRLDRGLLAYVRSASRAVRWLSPSYRMSGAYTVLREFLLSRATRKRREDFDEFVIEVWNVGSDPVRLVVESWQQGPKFRTSIDLPPGRTIQRIPAAAMNVDLYGSFGMISVYPENDAEAHVVFSWLDFVKYRTVPQPKIALPSSQIPGAADKSLPKVKCVIWDLDQTVWDGILGEQDPEKISVRPEVLRTIFALDERGILQSISSKNNHEIAWSVLERLGVAHFFLCPQINWQPKSVSVKQIANSLNIGVDSCLFIDDSSFERAEVSHEVPGIRILSDSDLGGLLERPELDVPITKESKQRRVSYVVESERKRQALEYGNRYEVFLKTCNMQAVLFRPAEQEHSERCFELLHRSNQLNLSTYRYTHEEFEKLLADESMVCICTSCRDRFGDYGIVGFASMTVSAGSVDLKDFVLSCRVAQKKLENAWFKCLASAALAAGYHTLRAPYTITPRNGVLRSTFLECGFVERNQDDRGSILEMNTRVTPVSSEIVSITAQELDLALFPPNPVPDVSQRREAAL